MENEIARLAKIKRTAFCYNILLSIFWSALNLTAIFIYSYWYVDHHLIYWSLAATFLVYLLPNRFLSFIQLSQKSKFYKKIGVQFVRKYAQEGDLVNQLIRKKYPEYRVIKNRKTVQQYSQQTYHFERFHLQLLLFFLVITGFAILKTQYEWALLLTLNNIIFNIYPNLLQQYNRLRLRSFAKQM